MGTNNNNEWEWNLAWRRELFDCEVQMADDFIKEL